VLLGSSRRLTWKDIIKGVILKQVNDGLNWIQLA
jgi:hypothetical protein